MTDNSDATTSIKPSLLVVDDEEVVRKSLVRLLENKGFRVTAAASGMDALELLKAEPFDLLLCDYKMPGLNGVETSTRAKAIRPEMACVLITGAGSDQLIVDAFTLGKVDYYLAKPFSADELWQAISHGLKEAGTRSMAMRFSEELKRKVNEATHELLEKNRLLEERERETKGLNVQLEEEHQRLLKLNERLETLSVTDGLTSLHNFRHFTNRLAEEFYRASRYENLLSLLILDLDDFKPINDAFGHLAGDETLKKIAEILRGSKRTADIAARYGGEEFAIILPEVGIDGAVQYAERLREYIAALVVDFNGIKIRVTTSVGVASLDRESMKTPQDLVKETDAALYHAKEIGKNCVVFLRDGQFCALGKENIITESSRKELHAALVEKARKADSVEEVMNYFVSALGNALSGGASHGMYVSIWTRNGSGVIMEAVSSGSYKGYKDIESLVRKTLLSGSLKTIEAGDDSVSAFPMTAVSKKTGEKTLNGALVINSIPSSLRFIASLVKDLGETLAEVEERRRERDISGRRAEIDILMKNVAKEACQTGDIWKTLTAHGDKLREILRVRRVSLLTFKPSGHPLEIGMKGRKKNHTTEEISSIGEKAEKFFVKSGDDSRPAMVDGAALDSIFGNAHLKPKAPAVLAPIWTGERLGGLLALYEPYDSTFISVIENLLDAICPSMALMIYNERRRKNGKTISIKRKSA